MKKVLIVVIILIVVIMGAVILFMKGNNSDKELGNDTNSSKENDMQSYYTATYSASYNTYNILNISDNYKVINDENELDDVLSKVDENDFKQFDKDFFLNNKLLIVQAGVNPKMHKFDVSDTSVDATIYAEAPLASMDQIFEYTLYLVPVSKDINNYNIEVTTDPDIVY